jgi:hypothetical protein
VQPDRRSRTRASRRGAGARQRPCRRRLQGRLTNTGLKTTLTWGSKRGHVVAAAAQAAIQTSERIGGSRGGDPEADPGETLQRKTPAEALNDHLGSFHVGRCCENPLNPCSTPRSSSPTRLIKARRGCLGGPRTTPTKRARRRLIRSPRCAGRSPGQSPMGTELTLGPPPAAALRPCGAGDLGRATRGRGRQARGLLRRLPCRTGWPAGLR